MDYSVLLKRIALGLIALIGVFFFMVRGTGSTAELFLWQAASPFTRGGSAVGGWFSSVGAVFGSADSLTAQIATLEREKRRLEGENARLASVDAENAELRTAAELPAREESFDRVHADVIGFNPGATKEWIVINRGQRDGVCQGCAVVVDQVLIGTVERASGGAALVRLVTNAQSVVRAQTAQHRTLGVVRGVAHVGARLVNVERSRPLSDGEQVVSVRNGVVPSDFLIGTAYNVHLSDDSLFQEATIAPAYEAALRDRVDVIINAQTEL